MKKSIFVFGFIALCSISIRAQWMQHYFRGPVSILHADNQQVFAAVDSSLIYRTTNQGAAWTAVNTGLPGGTYVTGFAVRNSIMVASGDGGSTALRGIFRTTNLGQSWSKVSGLPDQNFRSLNLVDSSWFASTYNFSGNPLYYSTNDGATWTLTTGLANKSLVNSIVKLNTSGSQLLAAADGGLSVSTDGGAAWQNVNATGLPANTYFKKLIASGTGQILGYVNSYTSPFLYSTANNGTTWTVVNPTGLPANPLMLEIAAWGAELYAVISVTGSSSFKKLYKSSTFGVSWTEVPTTTLGAISDKLFNSGTSFALSGTTLFAAGAGIFKSTNNGTNWTEASSGIRYNGYVNATASSSAGLFALSNNKMYQTSVYPGTFIPVNAFPLSNSYVINLLSMNNYIFAANDQRIVRSSNGGINWDTLKFPYNDFMINSALSGNNKLYVYATRTTGNWQYILTSTNNGTNWDTAKIPLSNVYFSSLTAAYNKVFASAYNKVYESTNLADWSEYPVAAISSPNIGASHPSDTSKFILYQGTPSQKGFIYFTSNRGASWIKATVSGGAVSGDSIPTVYSFLRVAGNILAATAKGVFLSANFGQSWNAYTTGMSALPVLHLHNTGKYVVASTAYYSAWFISSSTVNTEADAQTLPRTISLEQNYPNPFNPVTRIKYSTSSPTLLLSKEKGVGNPSPSQGEGQRVRLSVYDVLGNVVATLVNEEQSAGEHSVTFNAASLPSGTYFCELRAAGQSVTRKLLLLK